MTKQDYETPDDFIAAVEARWGKLDVDLACRTDNCKAEHGYYFDEGVDSLQQPWAQQHPDQNLWLNPEFVDIGPWVAKCAAESRMLRRGRIFVLTPASIGTNWFLDHVFGHAQVIGLNPRMTFKGMKPNPKTGKVDPYPKDLMLSVFGQGHRGFDVWRWK
jgi:phage N-6-adenine-methyltransferase